MVPQSSTQLPLFPLPNVVHFPRTDLRLHVFEPRYRQLVRDLLEREREERWIGMVLLREDDETAAPEIAEAGTAGRLVSVEFLPDGRSNIVLRGGFRFAIERELEERPYRTALVRPLREPPFFAYAPEVLARQDQLVNLATALAEELGERFPISPATVRQIAAAGFEETVNGLAAELDVPALRKLQLLVEPLCERADSLEGILRARRRVLDLLRPFRHLAGAAVHN
jgi:Lon protease-like protein